MVTSQFLFEDYELRVDSTVERDDFERWIVEELGKIRNSVDRLLSRTGVSVSDVDRLFLTGGSSLVPAVRRIFVERFGHERSSSGSEFTSVAKGLALRALEEESLDSP